ncbi:hypothetical protein [Haladaptatus halobius]|uniref:hypothetical protein n=1 Tax=Haladaptatus halobius TaxID=2884875 RepID=UPI001D0AE16B|nr:hypothetical protein [Haladaptatus halobius]
MRRANFVHRGVNCSGPRTPRFLVRRSGYSRNRSSSRYVRDRPRQLGRSTRTRRARRAPAGSDADDGLRVSDDGRVDDGIGVPRADAGVGVAVLGPLLVGIGYLTYRTLADGGLVGARARRTAGGLRSQ